MDAARAIFEARGLGDAVEPTVATWARIAAAGRAAWPGIALDDRALAIALCEHLREAPTGGEADHDADRFLAAALATGDPAALAGFEQTLVPAITTALARLRLPGGLAEEVVQAVRVDLLVGDPPRIVDYAGRGALAGWICVIATRRALRLSARIDRTTAFDDELAALVPSGARGHDRALVQADGAAALKAALTETFAALSVRQRNLLRQHVVDQLTIDELAALYGAHRATCARWLADARSDLARGTRARLAAQLAVRADELDSLLRVLDDSALELSLTRLLRTP